MSDTGITPLTPAQIAQQEQQAAREGFIKRDLVAIDEAAGTILGGPPDVTISSDLAVDATEGHGIVKELGEVGSKILDVFQTDHGAKAIAGDLERAQAAAADMEKAEGE
jgi:hypothetical protein